MWTGSEAVGWDHDREAAAYDVAADTWRVLPDLPLEGRDCLPRGVATAVEAPVWTGEGLVQWLGPSGRSDDGTWFRTLTP